MSAQVVLEVAKAVGKGAWHWVMRTFSVLAVIGLGWAVYAGIIRPVTKPNPTTTQHADSITNPSYKGPTFGCMSIRVMAEKAKPLTSNPVNDTTAIPGGK